MYLDTYSRYLVPFTKHERRKESSWPKQTVFLSRELLKFEKKVGSLLLFFKPSTQKPAVLWISQHIRTFIQQLRRACFIMLLTPLISSLILVQNSRAKDLPFYIFASTHNKTRASGIQLQKLDMLYLLPWKPNPKAYEALKPSELLTLLLNICLLPSMQTVWSGDHSVGMRGCWQCSLQPLFTVKESVTSSSNTKQLWMMPCQTNLVNHLPEWNVCSFSKKSSSSSPIQPALLFPSFFPDEFISAKIAVSVPPKIKKEKWIWANLPENISSQCFQIHQVISLSVHKSYEHYIQFFPVRADTNPLFLPYIRTWLRLSSTVFWRCMLNLPPMYAFIFIHLVGENRTKQHWSSNRACLLGKTAAPSLYVSISDALMIKHILQRALEKADLLPHTPAIV